MDIDAQSGLIQPLGPSGVRRRMAEIQSQLDNLSGKSSFTDALQSAQVSKGLGGVAPMSIDPNGLKPMASEIQKYKDLASKIADEEGIDSSVFSRLIEQESSWNPNAVSSKGATGLAQLMPGTAKGLGVKDITDPEQNLRGGAIYLRQMLEQFGDVDKALAAYNSGPGNVRKYGGVPPFAETKNYLDKIVGPIQNQNILSRLNR